MKFVKILFIVLIILLFAIIYTQNIDVFTQDFTLKLDLKTFEIGPYVTKNIVIILASFLIGAVVTIFFGALQSLSASADSKEKSRRIRELEARNKELLDEKQRADRQRREAEAAASSPFTPPSVDEGGSTHNI